MDIPLEQKSTSVKIYHRNLNRHILSSSVFAIAHAMLSRFYEDGIKDDTYESALEAQTVRATYEHFRFVVSSKVVIKSALAELAELGMIKPLGRSKYIINPIYSENFHRNHAKFTADIVANHFPKYKQTAERIFVIKK